ncbi:flavin reductase family protein [Streptomyces candidus]|uniref:Flavin reductase (DIM6/NTAB) family NADH-FMN oxidoreductase RutF n=1 Tax=Streptomyces candidus TaxID=67283 RepID=A0A7X0HFH9_9ACTN|nr:flavin reductase family protein [Streptomyces candidus]MBB6436674.1 flavin reductase (DIM6/NTAB) family NADH-FMN oxidoreductase RutF [Streptomyces candidus]GHH51014.1 monooxygenase [Streptomyces candidus]
MVRQTTTPTMSAAACDAHAFRSAMGRFPTGVSLLTQGSGETTVVITLNSLISVSLDPLLLLVSVKAAGRIRPRVAAAGSFAVNVLGSQHRPLAVEFSRADRCHGHEAMLRMGAVEGVTGNAVIPSSEMYVECELADLHEAGDHTLLVGRAVAVCTGDIEPDPLVFHQGRFATFPAAARRRAAA